MKAIPLLPLLALAGSATLTRAIRGSWLAPSAFTGVLWLVYAGLPLVITPYPIGGESLWVLVSLVFAMQLGALIHEDSLGEGAISADLPASATVLIKRASLACTLVSGSGALVYATLNLLRFGLPLSLEGLLSLGRVLYPLTQSGEEAGWGIRLARMWMFAGTTLGGMTLARATGWRDRWIAFGSFVPAVVFGATVAARLGILMSICCFLGGFIALWVYDTRGRPSLSPSLLLGLTLSTALAVGVYVRLDSIRGVDPSSRTEYAERIRVNFFGYLAAFDYWEGHLWQSGPSASLGWGTHTFGGVAEALGARKRVLGLYPDSVMLEPHSGTNIYTAFRGWLEDFSFAGALAFALVIGAAAGMAYAGAMVGRSQGLPVLGAYYAFMLWSPIISIWYYNGVLLAWSILAVVLAFGRTRTGILVAVARAPSGAAGRGP